MESLDDCAMWSLDTVAPDTGDIDPQSGGLLVHWHDVTIGELPLHIQQFAFEQIRTPREILEALLERSTVKEACVSFVETVRKFMTDELGARTAEVVLMRSGFLTEHVPTLEEIGKRMNVTRERVRQIEKQGEGVVFQSHDYRTSSFEGGPLGLRLSSSNGAECHGIAKRFTMRALRHPLAHIVRAWFDLYPALPLTDRDIKAITQTPSEGRCLRRVLEILRYPVIVWPADLWFRTEAQRIACEGLVESSNTWSDALSWRDAVGAVASINPGLENIVDVERTLQRLGEACDIGPGPSGRIVRGQNRLIRRMARKIVTYLIARATSVPIDELAAAISMGQAPFQVFSRPSVSVDWLRQWVLKESDLLIQLEDGSVALAPPLARRSPTGAVGILYTIVSRYGEPMRMQDLCDQASGFGLSRNQTNMLIHSRRAACLFMLSRGIVGLVGRDEAANPADYEGKKSRDTRKRVRPGHEIGFDENGALAADIQVRRSVREQGLGLPWPFSLALLNASSYLFVDNERIPLLRKPNGDLELPQLSPLSVVRIALQAGRLSITTRPDTTLTSINLAASGTTFTLGVAPTSDRPAWITEFEQRNVKKLFVDLDGVFSELPAALSAKRRLYALHGLLALGMVRRASGGWKVEPEQLIPPTLSRAFQMALQDPGQYPALVGEDKSATAWLVRAAWLSPNLGWSIVRHNDLSRDIDLDSGLSDINVPDTIGPREAALMRIVETAQQARDRIEHPANQDLLNETNLLVRRYLTAIGFTTYRAVRELTKTESWISIAYGHWAANEALGVWVLKPLGSRIEEQDLIVAQREAEKIGATTWAVTNSLHLRGASRVSKFDINLDEVGRAEGSFETLIQLSADPSDFAEQEPFDEDRS